MQAPKAMRIPVLLQSAINSTAPVMVHANFLRASGGNNFQELLGMSGLFHILDT